jgi:hypothetical protein
MLPSMSGDISNVPRWDDMSPERGLESENGMGQVQFQISPLNAQLSYNHFLNNPVLGMKYPVPGSGT